MTLLAAALLGLLYVGLDHQTGTHGRSAWSQLHSSQLLALGCYVFLLSWWIVYFSCSSFTRRHKRGRLQVFTLRAFLDGVSSHRGISLAELEGALREIDTAKTAEIITREEKQDEDLIREKARSSRDVQGIMIAVIVLLLTLIVIPRSSGSGSEYHILIKGPIFAVAITIVLMWGLSLDIFDTMLNSFHVDIREANEYRRHYYRRIGPIKTLSGAVSYGYIGHALMPIFVLMVFSWFQPVLAGFGTALYLLFAYPYYYGYWGLRVREDHKMSAPVDAKRVPRSWAVNGDAIERWVVSRDGDEHVTTIRQLMEAGDAVPSARDEGSREASSTSIDAQYWPPWVLCGMFLVPSALIMALSR